MKKDQDPVYSDLDPRALPALEAAAAKLKRAAALVARLRGPGGCPWDREQDHLTLRPYLIEEAYEVLDVLDHYEAARNPKEAAKSVAHDRPVPANGSFSLENRAKLKEELGDLLLQVLLHAQLCSERGEFDVGDVAEAMVEKLVHRHPHVFGEATVSGSEQVLQNWEALKHGERRKKESENAGGENAASGPKGLLDGLPKNLPSLQRAARIGEKAHRVGFDWKDWRGSMVKVEEELVELKAAIDSGNTQEMEHELGDIFFALCNLARHLKLQPEDAHRKSIAKFEKRFRELERIFAGRGKDIHTASLDELDAVWVEVKRER